MFGVDDALLGAGALSLAGSVFGANAAQGAADTQAGAARYAADVSRSMFDTTQQNLAPWLKQGKIALKDLGQLTGTAPGGDPLTAPLTKPFSLSDFQASPAYQFNLEQGMEAINKAAASRGAFYQPATLRDISRFSQGLASNEFQNAFGNYRASMGDIWNRLYGLSGSGQNAAAQLGGFGAQTAGQIGSDITGAANAEAAGRVGAANAFTGGLGNIGNTILLSQLLKNNQAPIVSGGLPMTGDIPTFS